MPKKKITQLTAGTTLASTDLMPVVDVSDTAQSSGGTTKKYTIAILTAYLNTVVSGTPTTNASLLTSGTLAFARLPVGTGSTSVAAGNHLHTGVYDPIGTGAAAAAAVTPSSLGLVIGTNVLAYSASTGSGVIVRTTGAAIGTATLTGCVINGATNTITNVPFSVITGTALTTQLPGGGVNGANQLLMLNGSAQLPALDGSLLTGLSSGFANPMTTLGDLIYGGASGAATRVAGNTTSTRKFLRSTGSGGAATAPAYDTVTKADVGLSSVEDQALSSWTGSTAIETLGEVLTGTWHAAAIDLANYSTGILPNASFPATLPVASGVNLTALNASNLSSGTVPAARIDFSGYQTILTNSAGLRAALSDETGTGSAVFATSPTLVTPILGAATATTINKVTFTAPAAGSTLTIVDGKTATFSNTITIAGTDGSTLNVGTGGTLGTAAYTAASAYAPTFNDSSSLRAILSDETGTGFAVFATSPTLITPALGVATCTSLNGCTINTSVLSGTNTGDQSLVAYATLASPALTGVPTAPTAAVATNTTQIATTAFVIANAGGGSVANPTGTIGLTAVNGVAASAMRSDGAPALSQAITPTWTNRHIFAQGSISADAPLTLSQTWNNSAVTFTGIKIAITDPASNAGSASASKPFEVLGGTAGSTSLLKVDKSGNTTVAGTFNSTGQIQSAGIMAAQYFYFNAAGYLVAPVDGRFYYTNNATSGMTRFSLGGETSSNAALQISGTGITFGKGDGTAGGSVTTSGSLIVGSTGTALLKILSALKSSFDCPSIAANGGQQTTTLTVTGAVTGNTVIVSLPSGGIDAGVIVGGYVSAADTVTIVFTNVTTGAIDPASATFRVTVFGF